MDEYKQMVGSATDGSYLEGIQIKSASQGVLAAVGRLDTIIQFEVLQSVRQRRHASLYPIESTLQLRET